MQRGTARSGSLYGIGPPDCSIGREHHAEFGTDKSLGSWASGDVQPERVGAGIYAQCKVEEWAAQALPRDELSAQQKICRAPTEAVALGQFADFLKGLKKLLADNRVTLARLSVQGEQIAGENLIDR